MCVDETADYEFTLGGDDGYKLFINDQPIIDDWTPEVSERPMLPRH